MNADVRFDAYLLHQGKTPVYIFPAICSDSNNIKKTTINNKKKGCSD